MIKKQARDVGHRDIGRKMMYKGAPHEILRVVATPDYVTVSIDVGDICKKPESMVEITGISSPITLRRIPDRLSTDD